MGGQQGRETLGRGGQVCWALGGRRGFRRGHCRLARFRASSFIVVWRTTSLARHRPRQELARPGSTRGFSRAAQVHGRCGRWRGDDEFDRVRRGGWRGIPDLEDDECEHRMHRQGHQDCPSPTAGRPSRPAASGRDRRLLGWRKASHGWEFSTPERVSSRGRDAGRGTEAGARLSAAAIRCVACEPRSSGSVDVLLRPGSGNQHRWPRGREGGSRRCAGSGRPNPARRRGPREGVSQLRPLPSVPRSAISTRVRSPSCKTTRSISG